MNKKLIATLTTVLGFGTVFAASFGVSYALQVKGADNTSFSIGIAPVVTTGFFANVYDSSGKLVSSNETIVNENNTSELMIIDLSLTKGQSVKLFKEDGSIYYGSSTSYSHNLSVACSKNAGLLTDTDNYIAVQNGTYDFYFKFSEKEHTNYVGTYVNVDDVKTIYVQDTWNENLIKLHYWGDNVIGTNNSARPSGTDTGKYDSGHKMYKFVVPASATDFLIDYQSKETADMKFSASYNAYYINWNGAMEAIGYNWTA